MCQQKVQSGTCIRRKPRLEARLYSPANTYGQTTMRKKPNLLKADFSPSFSFRGKRQNMLTAGGTLVWMEGQFTLSVAGVKPCLPGWRPFA
jgi:hypothetical protein